MLPQSESSDKNILKSLNSGNYMYIFFWTRMFAHIQSHPCYDDFFFKWIFFLNVFILSHFISSQNKRFKWRAVKRFFGVKKRVAAIIREQANKLKSANLRNCKLGLWVQPGNITAHKDTNKKDLVFFGCLILTWLEPPSGSSRWVTQADFIALPRSSLK